MIYDAEGIQPIDCEVVDTPGKRDVKHKTRGTTKQDYETPPDFIRAVEKRFGNIWIDLAAHVNGDNSKAPFWIDEATNSLTTPWPIIGSHGYEWEIVRSSRIWTMLEKENPPIAWLNPPFDNATPWAKKCQEYRNPLGFLTLASVGSKWMREHVFGFADVHLLTPRLTFVGETEVYTKDLAFSYYGPYATGRMSVWDWKRDLILNSWQYVNGGSLAKETTAR